MLVHLLDLCVQNRIDLHPAFVQFAPMIDTALDESNPLIDTSVVLKGSGTAESIKLTNRMWCALFIIILKEISRRCHYNRICYSIRSWCFVIFLDVFCILENSLVCHIFPMTLFLHFVCLFFSYIWVYLF